jgi:branched-chain amino acid transport system ATP-binding protein
LSADFAPGVGTARGDSGLNRSGVSILLVEQNVRQSLSICDMGYVLEGGRIVAQGPGHALLESEAIVQAYLGV